MYFFLFQYLQRKRNLTKTELTTIAFHIAFARSANRKHPNTINSTKCLCINSKIQLTEITEILAAKQVWTICLKFIFEEFCNHKCYPFTALQQGKLSGYAVKQQKFHVQKETAQVKCFLCIQGSWFVFFSKH